jgi:hypothetical protein
MAKPEPVLAKLTRRFADIRGSGGFNLALVLDKMARADIEWSWELP